MTKSSEESSLSSRNLTRALESSWHGRQLSPCREDAYAKYVKDYALLILFIQNMYYMYFF